MRQAVLITAYRDVVQLERLVQWFDDDFELYIHLDRRCREDFSRLTAMAHVHLLRTYRVQWGSYNHLRAIVLLMRRAYAEADLGCFHLITGADWPAVSLAELKAYGRECGNQNHVEHFPMPHADWGSEGGMERVRYYWIAPNTHRSAWGRAARMLLRLQRKVGLQRPFRHFGGALYGGGTYWSVGREAVGEALDYMDKHPSYLRRFRCTSIAEEVCLPTLWMGCGVSLVNNSMRYIDWGADGAAPQVLTEAHCAMVKASGALFARKVERGPSDRLISMLQE